MLALLCGGQGTLSDKIFDLVADQPAAEPVVAAATACLGEDPRKLVRTRGTDELSANHVSQILTVASALAIHGCIADLLTEQTAVTGYSVGEMAAWSIAGIWTAEEALRLTDVRAQLMDRVAGPDGRLGYVRGLDQTTLEPLLEKYRCEIAIRNPDRLAVKLACQVARPIDWSATLEALAELGVNRVLDLGPGHALAEMMQAFLPDVRCYAADGFRTIKGLRRWIASE